MSGENTTTTTAMIHMALVGCGNMANWHAQQLAKIPEVKVVAVVDPLCVQTKLFREKHFNDAEEYETYERLLDDRSRLELDAVLLITPHTLHYPQAKAALEHGLHVLVEKPMVTSSQHAYDLWNTVERTGKLLGITFQAPYTAEFGYLAEARDRGTLGKIQLIAGWVAQGWLRLTSETWRQKHEHSGGGMLYDTGAHLLNAIMWIMNDPVIEVCCFHDHAGAPVDINGVACMKSQNGAMASIAIGGNCPAWHTEIQIHTDAMRIVTDQYGGKIEMTGRDGRRIYPHVEHNLDIPAGGTPHLNFVKAILGKEPLRAPVRYGVLLSVLMDAMYESAKTGQVARVKPVPAAPPS